MIWVWFSFLVMLINIPFGYWRENVEKLSLQWFIAVHFPVLTIALIRIRFGFGWELRTFLILVSAYFFGQWLGAKWNQRWKKSMCVSSCLFRDLVVSRWIIIIFR